MQLGIGQADIFSILLGIERLFSSPVHLSVHQPHCSCIFSGQTDCSILTVGAALAQIRSVLGKNRPQMMRTAKIYITLLGVKVYTFTLMCKLIYVLTLPLPSTGYINTCFSNTV